MDDAKLTALLAADAPPAHDPAFTLAVLARIEQQQYRRALLQNVGLALGAALLLALATPFLETIWQADLAPLLVDSNLGAGNLMIAVLLLTAILVAPQLMAERD